MKRDKPTYRQLADVARVSMATVSRVVHGNPSVDPALSARIRKAAAQLGIDLPDKRNESRTVAFVLANRDILNPFHTQILLGAEAYCSAQGWELLFMSLQYSANTPPADLHLPQILGSKRSVRAVILGGTNHSNMLLKLGQRGIPFSILGNNVVGDWPSEQFDAVYSDDIQGARDLTTHLISEGHRNIWYIGDGRMPWCARCMHGYTAAMENVGYEPRYSQIHSEERQLGYLAMRSILSEGHPVSAVFASTDQVTGGVYEAVRQCDLRIPADISVAGFNNTDSKLLHPAATSVMEFPQEIGKHLADFVLRRVQNPGLPPQQLTIPTQLILRGSTRPLGSGSLRGPVESRIGDNGIH